ncbi:MAG TPA: ABC transporter substrate-binding protein, partial [Quisquiliibacterium sp.]|nr:ABC transporter substrate-binding protein [Quisquiliibacterium sp.]
MKQRSLRVSASPARASRARVLGALACAFGLGAAMSPPAHAELSDGIVKIGVLTDMSGPFVDNVGPGSVLATQLAVEEFGGKVRGKPIEVVVSDHQNKADIGAARAREWLDRDRVDVITELGNSAVALATLRIAADRNRMTMVTGAGASRISNEDCVATNVHWVYDTYALAKVGTQTIVERGAKSWYFIAADYSFGHALQG